MHLFAAVLKIAVRCEMTKARAQAWAFCCWFEQPHAAVDPRISTPAIVTNATILPPQEILP
jgi:hypothetical protein